MRQSGKKKRAGERSAVLMEASAVHRIDVNELIPGPKLRAKLGISAVTLWRWRHDERSGFPTPKLINGRLYFQSAAVSAWLAKQPDA